jgi:hypothetical protein
MNAISVPHHSRDNLICIDIKDLYIMHILHINVLDVDERFHVQMRIKDIWRVRIEARIALI